jgi:hypothetical protein
MFYGRFSGIPPSALCRHTPSRKGEKQMMSIWKFPIMRTEVQKIDIPVGAKILSVQMQNGAPCIWAIVDTEAKTESRTIAIIGTGNDCWCSRWQFIGTVSDGPFMWHVFADVFGA